MLINHEREKLINLIIFLSNNTNNCGKIKLFKLLYFIDFEHFKINGRSVTGLKYAAWKMGPVPTELFEEIDKPEPDMAEALEFSLVPTNIGRPMLTIKPMTHFNDEHFTKRELKIIVNMAKLYADKNAEEMIEATHLENSPWDRVFNKENNKKGEIPYEYALKSGEFDEMLKISKEKKDVREALG
ncbi:Panacea domain-containing protein [Glaciecola petra]|uniref:Panacea domain-containing protein n=1 Tax=Glaciecola petra TaxID=3075602 RepID=A0ABU2ZU40_9ALTE|nr:Panacea domain-containing protein [Aestuariibacter sp. P117]MDT0596110.1 Panacea domain-containing protein [Aestuariibacter sp. P117]